MSEINPNTGGFVGVLGGILYGVHDLVGGWINERLSGSGLVMTHHYAMGILRDGIEDGANAKDLMADLVAGVDFFDYHAGIVGFDPETKERFEWSKIRCAVAVEDTAAITESVIKKILAYPFIQLQVDVIEAEISMSNHRAIRNAEKLGFVRSTIIEAIRPGGEIGLFTLRRDRCPYWAEEKKAA